MLVAKRAGPYTVGGADVRALHPGWQRLNGHGAPPIRWPRPRQITAYVRSDRSIPVVVVSAARTVQG
jgi:hypothetical protein